MDICLVSVDMSKLLCDCNLNRFFYVITGDAVVNVYINHEKKFAFVEMRSVEEASNAMALDGISFEASPFLALSLPLCFNLNFSLLESHVNHDMYVTFQ